jgi:hypothetical protein
LGLQPCLPQDLVGDMSALESLGEPAWKTNDPSWEFIGGTFGNPTSTSDEN